jgi:hypothetical protein
VVTERYLPLPLDLLFLAIRGSSETRPAKPGPPRTGSCHPATLADFMVEIFCSEVPNIAPACDGDSQFSTSRTPWFLQPSSFPSLASTNSPFNAWRSVSSRSVAEKASRAFLATWSWYGNPAQVHNFF